jgi:hypothetical protein
MKKYNFGFSFHGMLGTQFFRFCIWFGNDLLYFQYHDYKHVHCGLLSKSAKTPDYMIKFFIGIQYE